MSNRLLIVIAIAIGVCLAVFALVYPSSPGGRQAHNIDLADQHALILRPLLANDPRFKYITVSHYTGQGGAIWVTGHVADDAVALALRETVESTDPPVAVRYQLEILTRIEAQQSR